MIYDFIRDAAKVTIYAVTLFLLITWGGQAQAAMAPKSVTVKHMYADKHQRKMIGRVLTTCSNMGASRKVLIASVAAITQESTAYNLRGGDRDSVGLFQIRSMHGSYRQRRSPEWAARWFCERAINVDVHNPNLTVADLCQQVQRSGYPYAYGMWTREAVRTYRLTMPRLYG